MRARSLAVLAIAPSAMALVVACGLDLGGLLEVGNDASVDATAVLDANGGDDAASGSVDATTRDGDDGPAGDDAGSASDDGGSGDADAAIDAGDTGPDAGPCTGVVCNGACLDASTCETCDGSPLFCASNGRCGGSCTACNGLPIQCFDCDTNRQNPVATCEPNDASAYCLNGDIYPRYHCGCPNDVPADCPGATQTCTELDILTGDVCRTCGEANTDKAACKGGGKCDEATARCK